MSIGESSDLRSALHPTRKRGDDIVRHSNESWRLTLFQFNSYVIMGFKHELIYGNKMLNIISTTGKWKAICECSRCREKYEIPNKYSARKSRVGHLCHACKMCLIEMGEITQDKLQKVFDYNPTTGDLTYRVDTLRTSAKDIATYAHLGGYLNVCINTKNYLAHRIIYQYMTGRIPVNIDHINHKRNDNRWVNLREVTRLENNTNTALSKNSTSNVNGVSIHKPTGKYRAYINKNYKQIHLGLYDTLDAAVEAREKANIEHNYHANHGK